MSTVEVATGAGASARAVLSRIAGAAGEARAAPSQAVKKAVETAACISPEERFQMISEAAYFRAEQRGFMVGDDLADWLTAESEIDALLLDGEPAQSSK